MGFLSNVYQWASVSVCLAVVLETTSKETGNRNGTVETVVTGRIYTFSTLPKFFLTLQFPEYKLL